MTKSGGNEEKMSLALGIAYPWVVTKVAESNANGVPIRVYLEKRRNRLAVLLGYGPKRASSHASYHHVPTGSNPVTILIDSNQALSADDKTKPYLPPNGSLATNALIQSILTLDAQGEDVDKIAKSLKLSKTDRKSVV